METHDVPVSEMCTALQLLQSTERWPFQNAFSQTKSHFMWKGEMMKLFRYREHRQKLLSCRLHPEHCAVAIAAPQDSLELCLLLSLWNFSISSVNSSSASSPMKEFSLLCHPPVLSILISLIFSGLSWFRCVFGVSVYRQFTFCV